ncbi:biotin transporter BioY [Gorillibacterium massiliense]|uniref:biotin transporter BioY n=1 Tax=Gorillibacterium massiliense TaxID=1280390 RepID=UPI0004BAF7FB|nr:biotin transporter BioY [Gorillibacterium massiliense]
MNWTLRGTVFTALFAAIVVVFGYISIPLGFTAVPITLQTLGVMLAGGLLGPRYGFISMALIILLTALGFPLLHGAGGMSVLLGYTGGFVIMWPFSAMLIGLLQPFSPKKGWLSSLYSFIILEVFGSLIMYTTGVAWYAHVAHASLAKSMAAACYPFLPGDAIKAAAATAIIAAVRQVFPPERLTGAAHRRVVMENKSPLA